MAGNLFKPITGNYTMTNNEQLRALMDKYGLTASQLAGRMKITVSAIDAYRSTPGTTRFRAMPDHMLLLAQLVTRYLKPKA